MRAHLFRDAAFAKTFVGVLVAAYHNVIVPWWAVKQSPSLCDPMLSEQVDLKVFKKAELDTLHA